MSDAAVPTGCYKCGRPGHWSRDCPLSAPSNPNPNPNPNHNSSATAYPKSFPGGAAPKPQKVPRTRPKVTPELLLSDNGLGYILRYFPPNFKYRGRGHEVEEAGSSKRLKSSIAELKERVARGADPTKLKEVANENEKGYDNEDVFDAEEPNHPQEDLVFNENVAEDMQEDIFNEIYKTVEETSSTMPANNAGGEMPPSDKSMQNSDQAPENGGGSPNPIQITDEVKARMEAKRLKALERAAARSRLLPAS